MLYSNPAVSINCSLYCTSGSIRYAQYPTFRLASFDRTLLLVYIAVVDFLYPQFPRLRACSEAQRVPRTHFLAFTLSTISTVLLRARRVKPHVVIHRFNFALPNCSAPCLLIAMPRPSKALNLTLIIVLVAVHPSPTCSRAIADDKITRSSPSSQSHSQDNNLTNPPPPSHPSYLLPNSSPVTYPQLLRTQLEPSRYTPVSPPRRQ